MPVDMFEPVLSIAQVLQLIGLAQALGGAGFVAARGLDRRAAVPMFYFLVLAGHFAAMFAGGRYIEPPEQGPVLALMAASVLLPATTCLLIVQVVLDAPPRALHLAILLAALPELALLALLATPLTACSAGVACTDWWGVLGAARIVASAAALLVVQVWLGRRLSEHLAGHPAAREKYWLITALTATLTLAIAVDLLHVMQILDGRRALLVATLNALLFVYLVVTLLFRLLPQARRAEAPRPAALLPPSARPAEADAATPPEPEQLGPADVALLARIRALMEEDKVYQYAEYDRESLARELNLPEHRVARVVRLGFGCGVGRLLRDYRLAEAKRQLAATDTPIGQLAFDAGFSSLPSFNRIFKSATGRSPSEFRAAAAADGSMPEDRPEAADALEIAPEWDSPLAGGRSKSHRIPE